MQVLEDFLVAPAHSLEQVQELELLARGKRVEALQQRGVARMDRTRLGQISVEPVARQMQRLFDMPGENLADGFLPVQAAGNVAGLAVENLREQSLSASPRKLLVEYAPEALPADTANILHFHIVWTG
ncbi:hypothetical protein [Thiomonas sp. FB-6]|uniref:hypothetical protein n=1 Tax=Thiomonas sp. FB-6 TaxID=1158291 RepID=UPI0012DCB58E|nr:hypothetical protein [Thiomonas sp. FB-6]